MDSPYPVNQANTIPPIDPTPVKPLDPITAPQVKPSFFDTILGLFMPPFTPPKILIIVLCVVIVLGITGGLFVFGMRAQGKNGTPQQGEAALSASPTPTDIPSDTPTDDLMPTDTDTPTPITTLSPTPSQSPTPSPTSTLTPTPTPNTQSVTIPSTASLDGFEANNGGGNTTADIQAGRNNALIMRGFVSFSLSSIPSGATIDSANIHMYQKSVDGSPYSALGNLTIDHLSYGTTLDNSAYNDSAILSGFANIAASPTIGWITVDVTDRVKDDLLNHKTDSQYRLRFTSESVGGDATGDFAHFEAADTGSGLIPQLIVQYH